MRDSPLRGEIFRSLPKCLTISFGARRAARPGERTRRRDRAETHAPVRNRTGCQYEKMSPAWPLWATSLSRWLYQLSDTRLGGRLIHEKSITARAGRQGKSGRIPDNPPGHANNRHRSGIRRTGPRQSSRTRHFEPLADWSRCPIDTSRVSRYFMPSSDCLKIFSIRLYM